MISKILEKLVKGEIDISQAKELIGRSGYAELGGIKLDMLRKKRRKFSEVIYCKSKDEESLYKIFSKFIDERVDVMGTRATKSQFEFLAKRLPQLEYDEVSGVLRYRSGEVRSRGLVSICSAGTSDAYVAEEAALTAEFMGAEVARFYDVGVAGIHRLFANLEEIRKSNVIIAVAGMEGALASVVAGLVDVPVIAVPTSIGYGASFQGVSALLTMLNSCAEGISVVNIDNGFGAGYLAAQINSLIEKR